MLDYFFPSVPACSFQFQYLFPFFLRYDYGKLLTVALLEEQQWGLPCLTGLAVRFPLLSPSSFPFLSCSSLRRQNLLGQVPVLDQPEGGSGLQDFYV